MTSHMPNSFHIKSSSVTFEKVETHLFFRISHSNVGDWYVHRVILGIRSHGIVIFQRAEKMLWIGS